MSVCANCSKKLSCGCQRRTASNGKSVCSNCLTSYEATFNNKSETTVNVPELTSLRKEKYRNLNKFIK